MALLDLRRPGVYTQERPTLPPTVGVIPSAVPCFIGRTEIAMRRGEDLTNQAIRIKSMTEYQQWFGGAPYLPTLSVSVDNRSTTPSRPVVTVTEVAPLPFKLFHALELYFANGGGPCFILSTGDYRTEPVLDEYGDAYLKALQKEIDITILVYPDGPSLSDSDYALLISGALQHCDKMHNRVTVIDVPGGNGSDGRTVDEYADAFHNLMPNELNLKKYGMAYFPHVDTIFDYEIADEDIVIANYQADPPEASTSDSATDSGTGDDSGNGDGGDTPSAGDSSDSSSALGGLQAAREQRRSAASTLHQAQANLDAKQVELEALQRNPNSTTAQISEAETERDNAQATVDSAQGPYDSAVSAEDAARTAAEQALADGGVTDLTNASNDLLFLHNNQLYTSIRAAVRNYPLVMPPSAAIAGIYVRTDAAQGVWKAPANVSVFGLTAPSIQLDDDDHANLNAPDNGKSINAIRAYPGRGVLVYGGRTLAGNDLEWRYVNVRRTFCFIEDSVARAMQDFVFAPNNQETWIKVTSLISSFLNRIYRAGGLFGATPQDAYEVLCGEPDTMTIDDVLNGIMRVVIRVAVARPAEFIVLTYEHKFELADS